MNIHYYVIRHSHFLLNQNQDDVPILSMQRRKEVYLGTYHYYLQPLYPFFNLETNVIRYQDIFNNILSITRSDVILLLKSSLTRYSLYKHILLTQKLQPSPLHKYYLLASQTLHH